MDLYRKNVFDDLLLNIDVETDILKHMDLVMIKLEDGSDEDLKILDQIYPLVQQQIKPDSMETPLDNDNVENSEHESGMCSDDSNTDDENVDVQKPAKTKKLNEAAIVKQQIPQKTKSLFLKNLDTNINRDELDKVFIGIFILQYP
jgi:hypothetical protein